MRERERGRDQGSFSRLVVAGDSNENKSAVRRTGSCVRVKRSCGPVENRDRGDIIYRASASEKEGRLLSRRGTRPGVCCLVWTVEKKALSDNNRPLRPRYRGPARCL